MPIRAFNIEISGSHGPCKFYIQLDSQYYTQDLLLGHLQGGEPYEPETITLMELGLRPSDTFIDIGGHVGFFSMLAAAMVGPAGKVFTFEPDPRNFDHLLRHIGLNGFHQVHATRCAVGEQSAQVEMFFNPDNDGGHALWDPGRHLFNRQARVQETKYSVPMVSLDDQFPDAVPGHTRLIKIDTEGNEVNVLRGATKFLKAAQVPGLIVEVNHFALAQMGTSAQELWELNVELGYIPFLMDGAMPVRCSRDSLPQTEKPFNLICARPEFADQIVGEWPKSSRSSG